MPTSTGGDGEWQPSVVIQGKLYHRMGPLHPSSSTESTRPSFAQIYVHDPSTPEAEAETRRAWMSLPKSTSKAEELRVLSLLQKLQHTLREVNGYVSDFVHAAEALESVGAQKMQLVIDPLARPSNAHERTYNKPNDSSHTFNEVSVLMLDSGKQPPKSSVRLRDGEGDASLHDIDEISRAFDPLHFVLLFPCGDDGWHPHIQTSAPSYDPEGPKRRRLQRATAAARMCNAPASDRTDKSRQVSCRQYYAYRIQQRIGNSTGSEAIVRAQRLFQVCLASVSLDARYRGI